MKRVFFFLAVLAVAGLSVQAQGIAVGAFAGYSERGLTEDADSARVSVLSLGVVVPIYLKGGLELAPEAAIAITNEYDPANISVGGQAIADDLSQATISAGVGAYWIFAKVGALAFKSGAYAGLGLSLEPTGDSAPGYESYFYPRAELRVPVIVDLGLGPRLFIRLSVTALTLSWEAEYSTFAGVDYSTYDLNLLTGAGMSAHLGLCWKF